MRPYLPSTSRFFLCIVYHFSQLWLAVLSQNKNIKSCFNFPENEIETKVSQVSESGALISLPCDTSQSNGNVFKWTYSTELKGGYSPIFTPDPSSPQKYEKIGEGASSSLNLGKIDKTSSGFYCCELFDGNPYNTYVSKMYAVLALPDNFKPTLTASPADKLVKSGTKIDLKCLEPATETQLDPSIVPTIQWTIPKGLPAAKAGSTSYSFTATEQLNGAKFQCSYSYPSTSGQQQKQFQSDQYTLAVRFSARLDEATSTSNKEPIAVAVTGRTTIDCSFLANPQIEENDSTFKWVKVALKQPTDESTSESEDTEKPVADQCSAVSANGIGGKVEEKVIVDGEDTELVPTQKKFSDGYSRTTFSLTIKNFDSSTDPGCYTCKLGSLERSFNVIELFVSPVKNNNSKDISTLKEVGSAYSMGAWSFTALLTSTILVHYLFSNNNNFS